MILIVRFENIKYIKLYININKNIILIIIKIRLKFLN